MNEESIWDEIYLKTNFSPAWCKPGIDYNLTKIINTILKEYTNPELNVLDIGCGNGRNSLIFDEILKPIINYTGIDFSTSTVEYCKKAFSKNKIFYQQDITGHLKYPDKKYDILFDCGCFHAIPPEKRNNYIDNITYLTRPGAIYILCSWYKQDADIDHKIPFYFPYFYLNEWFFNEKDIEDLFARFFTLKSSLRDSEVYPNINDGFIYFILNRNI